MRLERPLVPPFALFLSISACSSATNAPSRNRPTDSAPPACTAETATEIRQLTVGGTGFSVSCGRVRKGADVLFVNGTDTLVQVTLANAAQDDFDAQLPNPGSTYAHRFDVPGTYAVISKPDSKLTLFVTE